ncbi:phosphoribosyltransferase [Enterobacter roggenkampii]|uniref:phosphoribosyltransferase family protein n=1 Tax=Enterobacter roggenkampii TaxID=1812935 RepID=UPI001C700A14|nr:phosphoribosyltransferase family protein [Enterobacter roggenkampii]MBW9393711.1 phosphoribosyltransferase [Enterobacter roggenkampii]
MSKTIRMHQSYLAEMDFDLVVGIPRSGMIPASIIALNLNLPLASLDDLLDNKSIKHGITRKMKKIYENYQDAKKILIVDDSVYSGDSILDVKQKFSNELLSKSFFLAVYGDSKSSLEFVDSCLEIVPSPRVFEWNIFHHPCIRNSCFDIDGVLCEDPEDWQNDDGEKYLDFLTNAKPRFIPTGKINTIVTNRLEKYREITESWLSRNNIQYDHLIMLDLNSSNERKQQLDYFEHKSYIYKESKTTIFFESDITQAIEISNRTGKYVFCVDTNEIIVPGKIYRVVNKQNIKQKVKRLLFRVPGGKYIFNNLKVIINNK